MIEIDGSEGGGQLLRSSLSLSALTRKPFKMINIRGKREKPGLQNQHLTAVNSISKICNAKVIGNFLHSKELEFIPSEIVSGNYKFDIGTAGSTTLVAQTILPPLLFANQISTVDIVGGTANPLAPPALDVKEVFLYHLNNFGAIVNLEIEREGFYPKGNGKIKLTINPCKKLEFKIIKPQDKVVNVFVVASNDLSDRKVAKRMIDGFVSNFPRDYKSISHAWYVETSSTGCYIHANYKKIGMSILGERALTAENVGKECALKLLEEINSKADTDHFTADQLLLYLAISGSGTIHVSNITDHMRTNINIIEKFLDVKFEIKNNVIECKKI